MLPPDMARRRVSASSSGIFCSLLRALVGRSGVQGQGTGAFVSWCCWSPKKAEGRGGVTRRAGWTFVSVGVMGEGAGLEPYSFWSRREGERGRRVGWMVSSLSEGCGGGWVVDFAEVLGELMCVFGEGTMIRGEAERARGEVCRMCFGIGGSGRFMGGSGAITGMLFLGARAQGVPAGLYLVAGRRGREVICAMSSDEAWMVISREWVVMAVVLEVCLEWSFECDEAVDKLESVSDCDDVSSTSSSGIDSACSFGVACGAAGLNVHGMASFMRSSSFGVDACDSQDSSFFATHGFCVHRSLEKYALQAWTLVRGWP